MKKKVIIALSVIAIILVIMFAEYRLIMINLHPYLSDTDTLYIEIFGQVDEYYLEK